MNLRTEWTDDGSISNRFYTVEETVNEVKENFDIRRLYSAEGKDITIDSVTEKCLVQTSSNPLKDLDDQRKIHCPLTMEINRGDYVEYENSIWMIRTNVVNIDDAYRSARMSMCNYLLRWQNESGDIKERWCVTQNAVQYNNGESGNKTMILGSDQLMVLIPYDEDTIKLRRGKRFFISNDLEEPIVYELTRPDSTTYVKNGHGYLCIMVTEDRTNVENDRKDLMLCNYISPTTPPLLPNPDENPDKTTVHLTISSSKNYIKIGGSWTTFKGIVTDEDGNVTDDIGKFSIIANFADRLDINDTTLNQIKVKASDDCSDLVRETFELVFTVGDISVLKIITIEEM